MLSTLICAVIAIVLVDGVDRVVGIAIAWVVQVAAFVPLARALSAGRSATKPWLGGLGLRFGGLVVLGALAFTGRVTNDLPVAYGLALLVLLLAEGGWLASQLSRMRSRLNDDG